jgi:hypothetical protein
MHAGLEARGVPEDAYSLEGDLTFFAEVQGPETPATS